MAESGSRSADWAARRILAPAPTLPLVYFGGAHAALALVFAALAWWPDLPGAFHYHPRLIALVHLVTLGWISGSILGAFYIVAPLALGMPFPVRRSDGVVCALFWTGTLTIVSGFWMGLFSHVWYGGVLVLGAIGWVAARAARGFLRARVPRGVALHVLLAFANVLVAGGAGMFFAVNRTESLTPVDPLAAAAAHAHLAVLGWPIMMIFGLSYRLIPMFLPAAMPKGRALVPSAVLLEAGTLGLAGSLLAGASTLPWACLVVAAFVTFVAQVRGMLRLRRPRPAAMAGRDWATWQTHAAFLWALVALGTGAALVVGDPPAVVIWVYAGAGLLGFVGQMIVGIQGRLLPLHAWYRGMAAIAGAPPPISVYELPSPLLTRFIFLLWLLGVPVLIGGLAAGAASLVAGGASALFAATLMQMEHGWTILRRARQAASRAAVVRDV